MRALTELMSSSEGGFPSASGLSPQRSVVATDQQEDAQTGKRTAAIFGVVLVGVVFLQKFGVPLGAGVVIPIGLVVTYAVGAFLLVTGIGRVNGARLAMFCLFSAFGMLNLIATPHASTFSFVLVSVLALTFVLEVPVTLETFRRCMRLFVTAMLITTPVVLLEWGLQLVLGPGLWVDLDAWVPSAILVPNYMYRHPTSWGSPWMQPNAAVFLEVSVLSQFLAIALLVELAYFSRPLVLAILFATMMITLGGSGPFMLTLSAPIILCYFPRKLALPALFFIICTVTVLSTTSVFSDFTSRIDEFENPRSSAYGRYVVPFRILGEQLMGGGGVFFGHGPGSGDDAGAGFSLGKLIYEYGWLGAMAYVALFLHMLLSSGHKLLVVWALSLFFALLGGGLGVPLYPLTCLVLGGLLVIQNAPDTVTTLDASRIPAEPRE